MKKSTMIAAVFAASAFAAMAADVYSSNIVGYTKLDVNGSNFSMLGVQFQEVGGGSRAINDLFAEPAEGAFVGGIGLGDSDQLRVWDASIDGYKNYFFGDWAAEYGAEYDNLWYWEGDDANPTTDLLPPGAAVWFMSKSATNVYVSVSGEVVSTNVTVTLNGGNFTMVANPFPVALSLSDVTASGTMNWIGCGLTGGIGLGDSDQVRVWDASIDGYKNYFYGNWNAEYGAEFDNQWYWEGDDANPTTDSIPVGGAAWFYLQETATDTNVTFPAP